jgi:hypothetical protein
MPPLTPAVVGVGLNFVIRVLLVAVLQPQHLILVQGII